MLIKCWSAITTLIFSLIIVTPLCGFLFQCGCDWPWSGLDTRCNFYKPDTEHKCPWCASMIIGLLSVGTAAIAGLWTSIIPISLFSRQHPVNQVLIRTLTGITVFVVVATVTASISALWQTYPMMVTIYKTMG